ncbi:UDP-glycosyltransferase UGT5-like isoform X2 [Homalodisca vitripennis]|uniref:UDP-glycosyltransferase UGT5-like isoform X2 n=1 Tax=Homalodisca vitripennis TaxID=197043 RepID=UPI001EEB1179|nr:UDP-glycosyltransferase UGT5-like isoform X2 [Homalodisca vitripennis]
MRETWKFDDFFKICSKESFYGFGVDALWEVGLTVCEDVLKDSKISALLNSTEKFDLVFIEPLFAQESFIVFGHKFQAPVVNFQGFGTWSILNYMSGNSLSIPYIPDSRSFPFSNKMSFMERLQNTISTVITLTSYHMTHLPKHQKLIQQYYKNSTSPPILDMLRNISLTLANAHHTLEYTRPYTPNIVPIGGAHMSSHQDDLPQNIKNFLDDAKEGFIYFSLGTIVPAHVLPDSYTQAFLNTFRKLPNKVLWKFGIDNLPGLPKNVKLIKWAPQQAVLEHPNCVLFITHGGVFSQYETLHAGVPVVGIPFFGDQRYNVKYYEDLGVGVKLDFLTITEETFHTAITTVLNDTRYKKNAESLSKIVRDKPMAPLDSAVFWIEYVLRHPGQHLRPASALLPWYQLWLLDVATTIIIFLILVYLILYKLSRYLLSCCNRKKTFSISNHKKIK